MMGISELTEEEKWAGRVSPPSTATEIAKAAYASAFESQTTSNLIRSFKQDELEAEGTKLTVPELDAKFPELKGKFTKDTTLAEANFIKERHDVENNRKATIAKAHGFFDGTVVPAVAGIAGAMSDPIDLLAGMAFGAGVNSLAKGANIALKGVSAFTADVASNIMGNSMTEVFNYGQTKRELREYTAEQAFNSVILSSVASTTLSTAGHALFKKLGFLDSKQVASTTETAALAIQEGVSPHAVLSKIDAKLEEDFRMDDTVKSSIEGTDFANAEAKKILLESENLPALRDNLKRAVDEGKISTDEMFKLSESFKSSGIDSRKNYIFDEDSQINFGPDGAKDIAESFSDPKNDINYHPEEQKIMEAPEVVEPSLDEKISMRDEELASIEKTYKETGREDLLKEVDSLTQLQSTRKDFAEFMANCLGGLVG